MSLLISSLSEVLLHFAGAVSLLIRFGEMRFFNLIERPLRSFAGHCHWFGEVHAKARATCRRQSRPIHRVILIDDAGSSRPVFPASSCICHRSD